MQVFEIVFLEFKVFLVQISKNLKTVINCLERYENLLEGNIKHTFRISGAILTFVESNIENFQIKVF